MNREKQEHLKRLHNRVLATYFDRDKRMYREIAGCQHQYKQRRSHFFRCGKRACPYCHEVKKSILLGKVAGGLKKFINEKPTCDFLLITASIIDCKTDSVRNNIDILKSSFPLMIKTKEWSSKLGNLGYISVVECSKNYSVEGMIHPHLHIVVAVQSSFRSYSRIKRKRMLELWKQSVKKAGKKKLDVITGYEDTASIHVKFINRDVPDRIGEILKVISYSMDFPESLLNDGDMFDEYIYRIIKLRTVQRGGHLRKLTQEAEEEWKARKTSS